MYKKFVFENLDIISKLQIYTLVKKSFQNYKLDFERFMIKHNGYCGSSFGYYFTNNMGQIKAWRAYLPMLIDENKIVHIAGVDACVDIEYQKRGILQKLTKLTSNLLNYPCIVYGYPNSSNKSYERENFETLTYLQPRLMNPFLGQKNQCCIQKDNVQVDRVLDFKSQFLESIAISKHKLFSHPTYKYALINHNERINIPTTIKAASQAKMIIKYRETKERTGLVQVGKSFHCDLLSNALKGSALCDFL